MRAKEANYLEPGEIAVTTVLAAVLAFVFIVPFLWMTLCSLKVPAEFFIVPMQWLPKKPQWANYLRIFNEFPFLLDFRNTSILVVVNI